MPIEPWRQRHPLESPIWKIRRAEKHIESINTYIHLWESLEPSRLVRSLNTDQTLYEYRVVARFPPLLDIGFAIGEFAYQLRSALDQIVYALSVFPDGLTTDDLDRAERTTSFPVRRTRDDKAIRECLKFVPDGIKELAWKAIDSVQPYQQGDMAEYDPLSVLDQMNIRDKHRVLEPAVGALTIDRKDIHPRIQIIAQDSINDGDIIARVPADLDPEEAFDRRITRAITIPISRPAGGVKIARIGEVYSCVAFDVLPRFVALFPPLPSTVSLPRPPSE